MIPPSVTLDSAGRLGMENISILTIAENLNSYR